MPESAMKQIISLSKTIFTGCSQHYITGHHPRICTIMFSPVVRALRGPISRSGVVRHISSSSVASARVGAENGSNFKTLHENDPELFSLLEQEQHRQVKFGVCVLVTLRARFHILVRCCTLQLSGLELIASENFTSTSVMQMMGSCLTNKVWLYMSNF